MTQKTEQVAKTSTEQDTAKKLASMDEDQLNQILILSEAKLNNLEEIAQRKNDRIEKILNDEIKTSLAIEDDDSLNVNDRMVKAKSRSVTAVISSSEAKQDLKKIGLDIDALIDSTSNMTPEIRGFAKERIASRFRNLAKKTMLVKQELGEDQNQED